MKKIESIHENDMYYLYWGNEFYDSYFTEEEMNADIEYLRWYDRQMGR